MRRAWLSLSDEDLVRACEVDRFRASGPGGQKRNKTESAVRLRHSDSGLSAVATESRSQHENKARAIRRLREKLALDTREVIQLAELTVPKELAQLVSEGLPSRADRARAPYLLGMAQLLDVFAAAQGSVRDTGDALGIGSAAVSKLLCADDRVLSRANAIRRQHGLKVLR